MSVQATCRDTVFAGLPACELTLPQGDRVLVVHHGAQVLSWVAGGRERLYLSPHSVMDAKAAIRGGIPVCFPQFNQRGQLPKHGFARQLPWSVVGTELHDAAVLTLALEDSAATRQWWPQAFRALLRVRLNPGALQVGLEVHNTDQRPWRFTGALHTYLVVSDVAQTRLHGLGGQAEWNALTDQRLRAAAPLRFAGEFDRVYAAPPSALVLEDGPHRLEIGQDVDWAETVVWNPGEGKGAALPDMPVDGWRHMLCVEAAQVHEPIELAPGAQWKGSQCLRVA